MKNSDTDSLDSLLHQITHLRHHKATTQFKKLGLHRGQPPILFMLWEKEGLTQKELAEGLNLTPPTVTDALHRIEKLELIERRTDQEDLRVTRVYLTEKGRNAQTEVNKTFQALEEQCFGNFTFEEKILLRRFFIQIVDNLSKEESAQ